MNVTTGLYEVLNAEQQSSVHSTGGAIATLHSKESWVKDLTSNAVKKVQVLNSSVPFIPGSKIGLSFISGDEIIAFKRTKEIPVETALQSGIDTSPTLALSKAVGLTFFISIPIIGYIYAMAYGIVMLVANTNVFGKFRTPQRGNRLLGLCSFIYGLFAFFIGNGSPAGVMVGYHILLAIVALVVIIFVRLRVFNKEKELFSRASHELETVWLKSV